MMRQIYTLLWALMFASVAKAQTLERQVTVPGGGSYNGNFYADWTMGETVVQSAVINGIQFQQGYQQPVTASGSGVLQFSDAGVRMYPNPGSGNVQLEWDGMPISCSVEVFNLLGEKMLARSWETGIPCMLDLSNLPAGSYLVQLTGVHTRLHATLIKI